MKQVCILLALFGAALVLPGSGDGPLPENTNAPGEFTCGRSVCHNIPNNVGPGKVTVFFADGATSYFPDSTYLIRIRIDSTQTDKNGFQILALNQLQKNTGAWILTDTARTTVISGISFPNRKYVTHTRPGNRQREWTVKWKAPANATGPVTFYASGLASNKDSTNQGDLLYTTLTAVPLAQPNPTVEPGDVAVRIYPVPAHAGFWIEASDWSRAVLFSAAGVEVRRLAPEGTEHYMETTGLNPGVYFLHTEKPGGTGFAQKIVIE